VVLTEYSLKRVIWKLKHKLRKVAKAQNLRISSQSEVLLSKAPARGGRIMAVRNEFSVQNNELLLAEAFYAFNREEMEA
jgi:hypothetical protein